MKKLAVLSIALLMLTTLVFAEVMVEPTVAFSGSGTLTWGIDLDTTANHGFSNTAASNLTVTLVAASDETKGGAEGETVFGAISLTGMALAFNSDNNYTIPLGLVSDAAGVVTGVTDDTTSVVLGGIITAPTVEAYVMLGPAKWFIYAAPDLAITFAAALEDDANDAAWWAEGDETDNVAPDFGAGATGVEIAAGPATIDVLIASGSDWTTGPAAYGAGLKATLAIDPLTIKLGANYPFAGGPLGAGVSLGLVAGPATVSAGFDMTTAVGTPIEVAGGVALALPDVATITANAAWSNAGWDLDAEVGATLSAIPGLDFSTLVGLWNITAGLDWGVKVAAGYKIAMGEVNYVTPAVTAYISSAGAANALWIALTGTVTAVLIPNTTFVLTYADNDLTGGTDRTLTFATTVTY